MPNDEPGRDRPRDFVLLALTAVAASADAITYLSLNKVFPANMTGNTVLLAIGITGREYVKAARSAVALGAFVLGAFLAGLLGARASWRSLLARGLAAELALLAAAFGWWVAVGDPGDADFGLVALISLAMGVQSAVVARLGVGVSTTYITGTWTGLSSWAATRLRGAPAGGPQQEHRHGRQALVLACYFGAALAAGFVQHASLRYAIAVPFGLLACLLAARAARGIGTAGGAPVVRLVRYTDQAAAQVWQVLADAGSYADWVSGTARIRSADPRWPAPGASLRHRFGAWPLRVNDRTTVVECEPQRRLVLHASALPWGAVTAEITLTPEGGRTRVELCEAMRSGVGAKVWLPANLVQRARNRHSLERLLALAERGGD